MLDNGRLDGNDDIVWDFDWSECPGATLYHLYVIGPSAPNPLIDQPALSEPGLCHVSRSYILEANRWGWTWKVRAYVDGSWGPWSPTRSFDVEPVDTDPLPGGPPAWPMFRHDPQHTGVSPFLGPQSPAVRWTFQAGTWVDSSPAVGSDGRVYVGSDGGSVYALDGMTGAKKWEFSTLMRHMFRCSPAIGSDGTVYVDNWDGYLYALDGSSGSKLWEFYLGALRHGNSGLTLTPDGVLLATDYTELHALDAATGQIIWQRSAPSYAFDATCPAVGPDGTIYITNNNDVVYAIDGSTGGIRWSKQTDGWTIGGAAMAVGPDGVVYVPGLQNVVALIGATGDVLWQADPWGGGANAAPAIVGETVVLCGSSAATGEISVVALERTTGALIWSCPMSSLVSTSPAVGADGTIYVASVDGVLHAIDTASGSVKWELSLGAATVSSPAIGLNQTLYIGCRDGNVYAIGP